MRAYVVQRLLELVARAYPCPTFVSHGRVVSTLSHWATFVADAPVSELERAQRELEELAEKRAVHDAAMAEIDRQIALREENARNAQVSALRRLLADGGR